MTGKKSADFRVDPAPRAVVEDAISETLESAGELADDVARVDPELRHEMIARVAYYLAEQRGFAPGHEQEDWYRAQAAVDRQLARMMARG
jgi:hypothetical protein